MAIYRDREIWKGHYVIAVPSRGLIYFDDCAFSYANSEIMVLTHETIDGCGQHAGGIYIVDRRHWDRLLEPQEGPQDATKSRVHWNTLFTDYYERDITPSHTPVEPSATKGYYPYYGSQNFVELVDSVWDHGAVIRMKLACEPWRSSIREAFEQQPNWRKLLMD